MKDPKTHKEPMFFKKLKKSDFSKNRSLVFIPFNISMSVIKK